MPNRLHLNCSFAVLILTGLFSATSAADHIDFIRDDSNLANGGNDAIFSLTVVNNIPVVDTQTGDAADILGQTRTVTLTRTGTFGGTASVQRLLGSDFIDFDSSNTATAMLTLDYNGIENSDFSSQWDAFLIEMPLLQNSFPAGAGRVDIRVAVESSAGNGISTLQQFSAPSSAGNLFAFEFDDAGFANVDFSDVDRVTFDFQTGIIGTDFQIGSITRRLTAIPEPAGAGLLLVAATGLAVSQRRRRRSV